jgi:methionine biosynthesis protein MetW
MEATANTLSQTSPVAAGPSASARDLIKQDTDLHILSDWIEPGSRVLDLGCGRGILLEHLLHTKRAQVMGVDNDLHKIIDCVARGVPVYQGDILDVLGIFPDNSFDWVVCSRTIQELAQPAVVLERALSVGRRVAVGFVNHGYWINRLNMLWRGHRVQNEVYPEAWYDSHPTNPVAVGEFRQFCTAHGARVVRRAYLAGDWRTPCRFWPRLLAGYAIYEVVRAA